MNIPLKNKEGSIVAYAIVDEEDYEKVSNYKWYGRKVKDEYKYAISSINNKNIRMHHFVFQKPTERNTVVDHINGNGLDNRKSNLRIATRKQNAQNKSNNSTSYIGVFKLAENKYKSYCCNKHIGVYKIIEEAAKMYDIYVYLTLGEYAKTNNLITYEESQKYTLEDILPKQKERNLPDNVWYDGSRYKAEISYKNQTFRTKSYKILQDLLYQLRDIRKLVNILKDIDEITHYNMPIQYDENNNAIVPITNKNIFAIVDKKYWHDVMKYKWSLSNGYPAAHIGKIKLKLHQYIYKIHYDDNLPDLIDHINKNRLDNRLENLIAKTATENSHNKSKNKNATSKYYGVSWNNRRQLWIAQILKENKSYWCGQYKNEIDAAKAYNEKAIELYGKNANLNII